MKLDHVALYVKDGYYESCFLDKEGNQIELVA